MQDPITSGMEFIVISIEGFQPLTGIAKNSGVLRCSCISLDYYFRVCNILDQKYTLLRKVFSEATLVEHLSPVGARQHDLPCESLEWLLHGVGFY